MLPQTLVALAEVERTLRTRAEAFDQQQHPKEYERGVADGLNRAADYAYRTLDEASGPIELRCSSLPLAIACPASQLPDIRVDGASQPARTGTAVHTILAKRIVGDPIDETAVAQTYNADPDEVGVLVGMAMQCWGEVSHAFTAPTVEKYYVANGLGWQLTGHIDVLSMDATEAFVIDWKTGYEDSNFDAQTKGYAYLVMANHPAIERVYLCPILVRRREFDGDYFTRSEIEGWWNDQVPKLLNRGVYHAARHCAHCPRAPWCPAKTAILAQTATALVGDYQARTYPTSPRALGDLYDKVLLVEAATDTARDALFAEVSRRGGQVDLPDGRQLVITESNRKVLDYRRSYPILVGEIGDDGLAAAATLRKSEVDKAVMKTARRGAKKEKLAEVYASLEEAGAVQTTIIQKLEMKKRGYAKQSTGEGAIEGGSDAAADAGRVPGTELEAVCDKQGA